MPVAPCHLIIGGQLLAVPLKKEAIIGRSESASGWNPDVDLATYGGTSEGGISRKHAKIVWQGKWLLEDLSSTNGTFLRGQRLSPGTRAALNNGEVFQIGSLQITFFAQ
jgi:pSer/pThr/pTyr-binding forkhead associated (FHA) protein